jgi:hypothetical protein
MKNGIARFSTIVLTLTFAASAFSQQKAIVHSLGVTSLTQAHQREATTQFSGKAHEALRPMPDPRVAKGTRAASIFSTAGQKTEFSVVGADKTERGFTGLTSNDSNVANGGGLNGVLEPPDQGLATNSTQVFETVNLALRIYTNGGKPLSPAIGIAAFFGVPVAPVDPYNNLSDPRVFFDAKSKRFFFSILEYQQDPNTGAFLGSEDLLAVSQTSDATGNYYIYLIDGCPADNESCLADQPLIGLNDDGFYFSNNDFDANGGFLGARIVALDREALVSNTPVNGISYVLPNDFSVEPALPAPGAVTTQNDGTEYFTESLDFGPPANGNSLRIFALTGTETLENSPMTNLATSDFPTEAYSSPYPANQKAGAYPLGQQFGDSEEYLNPDDDRMLQLYYAGGKLYTTLETLTPDADAPFPTTSAAWFVIQPTATTTTVSAHIAKQGYIGIADGSVLYPAFAVNSSGKGIIGFSFSGSKYYPSTGYVHFSGGAIGSEVHTAGAGQNPEDGFTGYPQFGGKYVSRWGDYSAAFVAPDGGLWFAAEYIPNDIVYPRTSLTNWGTFVSHVQ